MPPSSGQVLRPSGGGAGVETQWGVGQVLRPSGGGAGVETHWEVGTTFEPLESQGPLPTGDLRLLWGNLPTHDKEAGGREASGSLAPVPTRGPISLSEDQAQPKFKPSSRSPQKRRCCHEGK